MNPLNQALILALRLGRRSLGQSSNRLLVTCIILCTCIATSLNLFSKSMQSALEHDITTFLGAPMVIRSNKSILQTTAITTELSSIPELNRPERTQTLTTGAIANEVYQSVSLKGVSRGYPLNGDLIIKLNNREFNTSGKSLKESEAWLDRRALENLALKIGDHFQIGDTLLTVAGEVIFEPDRLTQLQHTLPRIIVSEETLSKTGVLVENDRVEHRILFSGSESALVELETLLPKLTDQRYDILKPKTGHHPFARVSLRAERILNLVLALVLLMCGGAAAMLSDYSMRYYALPTAVLRCLGLRRRTVTLAFCLQLLLLTVTASAMGCLFAWLLHPALLSLMKPHMQLLNAKISFTDLGAPISVGLAMVGAFVVPSLQRLTSNSISCVLHGEIKSDMRIYLHTLFASLLVVTILWLNSDNPKLTAMLVAAVGMLILLSVVFGWGLGILSAQVHHFLQGPLKIAVRAIGRSPHCHITPLVSVAVTLMALLMATTLRGSFLETLQIQRLEADGNYIFTGLPEYKKSQFIQFLNDKQIELKGIYPTVQANLIEINGLPIDEALDTESDTREQIRSKVRLSWAEKKPENNTLIQGQWPARKSREVSVEQEVMSDLNLKIGDVLGFQIGNKVVRARIASARKYNGQSSSMMFWFMFAPDALENYKHRYMGGLLLKENVVAHLSTLVSHWDCFAHLV